MLNQERYQGAQILLARENFGCGSSREHAVWALYDYGFRCVIAPSFADIFFGNSGKNGLLTITLDAQTIDNLFDEVETSPGYRLTVDLDKQTLLAPSQQVIEFQIEPALKQRLLNGLDDIGITMQHQDKIKAYEKKRQQQAPWLFPDFAG